MLDAFENHCTKKRSCFFGGFPFEQICPEKTAFHRDLVFHSLRGARVASLFSPSIPPGPLGSARQRKPQRMTVVLFVDAVHSRPKADALSGIPDKVFGARAGF